MHHLSPKFFVKIVFTVSLLPSFGSAYSKSIFLNGTDISNVRNQHLKKVDMFIDPKGNIIVQASHYQVHLVDHYTPLQYPMVMPSGMPTHKPPQVLSGSGTTPSIGGNINSQNQPNSLTSEPLGPPIPSQNSPAPTEASSLSAKVAPSGTTPPEIVEIPLEKLEPNLEDERLTPKIGSKTVND